ncbi:MAG: ATP-binding protein [Pseudomonadota bacterium]
MSTLPSAGPSIAPFAFGSALCAASAATLGLAAEMPAVLVGALTVAAAGLGAWGVRTAWRHRPLAPPKDTTPFAVTTAEGRVVSLTPTFEPATGTTDPAALARTDGDHALLFGLRRRALAGGEGTAILSSGTAIKVRRDGAHLIHTIETIPASAPPSDGHALIVDLVPAPAAILAADGRVLAKNTAFATLAGDAAALHDILSVERDAVARFSAHARIKDDARLDAVLREGERRVRATGKALGEHIIVALSDVTDAAELESQIAQNQKMQAIGQLAGGIAHDFNNVLTAIIGFSDLLLQNHRPSDPAFRDIMNIKQSAERAAGLVKQLLAFSRRQTLRPAVLNLNDVIGDLSLMLDRLLGETIHLKIEHGRDLWPVLADRSQIEQVVINLAVNARDAMPAGGHLVIRTQNVAPGEREADSEMVLIEVEDVGTGMPPDVLAKIFEPFFTTKGMGEGTGLGLSTVYGIVKQTGGTLSVASEEGSGTRFDVFLPRTADAPARTASATGSREAVDLTGSATVLLAEDEEAIRMFAARALSAKGYRVLSAANGQEAAEIFDEEGETIDLLLTDVIMPERDGPSLVAHVRESRPDLKVVFMSGYADGASVDDLGAATFLPKPFTLKALAETVKMELSGR